MIPPVNLHVQTPHQGVGQPNSSLGETISKVLKVVFAVFLLIGGASFSGILTSEVGASVAAMVGIGALLYLCGGEREYSDHSYKQSYPFFGSSNSPQYPVHTVFPPVSNGPLLRGGSITRSSSEGIRAPRRDEASGFSSEFSQGAEALPRGNRRQAVFINSSNRAPIRDDSNSRAPTRGNTSISFPSSGVRAPREDRG